MISLISVALVVSSSAILANAACSATISSLDGALDLQLAVLDTKWTKNVDSRCCGCRQMYEHYSERVHSTRRTGLDSESCQRNYCNYEYVSFILWKWMISSSWTSSIRWRHLLRKQELGRPTFHPQVIRHSMKKYISMNLTQLLLAELVLPVSMTSLIYEECPLKRTCSQW